jgi:hypothetical protein
VATGLRAEGVWGPRVLNLFDSVPFSPH